MSAYRPRRLPQRDAPYWCQAATISAPRLRLRAAAIGQERPRWRSRSQRSDCATERRSARPIRLLSALCLGPPASTQTVARAREQASTTPITSLPNWNATSAAWSRARLLVRRHTGTLDQAAAHGRFQNQHPRGCGSGTGNRTRGTRLWNIVGRDQPIPAEETGHTLGFLEWSQPGSNRRPPACKAADRAMERCNSGGLHPEDPSVCGRLRPV
jgi:hypothetical protein